MTMTRQHPSVLACQQRVANLVDVPEHRQKVRRWARRLANSLRPVRIPVSHREAAPELSGLPLALSAANSAGIELIGHRVAVINNHSGAFSEARWSGFARDDITVVAPKAAQSAGEIAIRLLSNGRKAQTPVAFIRHKTNTESLITVTSLGDVSLRGCPYVEQTVMIIGEIAGSARTAAMYKGVRPFRTHPIENPPKARK